MLRITRPATTLLAATLVGLVGLPTGVGYAAFQHDRKVAHVLPRATLIGGIDVSGLSRQQAVVTVEHAISARLDSPGTLLVGDRSYRVTARELGVAADVPAAVDAALRKARSGSWISRSWSRLRGKAVHPVVEVKVTAPVVAGLQRIVDRAAAAAAKPAADADAELVGGWVSFTPARPGLAVDKAVALAALQASLVDGTPRRVDPHPVQPKVTDAAFDTVLLVRANENKLYVYKHGKIATQFDVATGMLAYPTPLGRFTVTRKRFLPTWVNPHPNEGWGRFEPKTIGPGPHNPLGLRALNLSAPNIRIHGTPADSSIGYNASHGCIRMHNRDVVKLYPMVPKGTTVFITRVGAPKRHHAHTVVTDPAPTEGG